MNVTPRSPLVAVAVAVVLALAATVVRAADPLPSWNDGPAKRSVIAFVEKVSKEGSPDFVPVAQRIATFDNDGTLWCEKPMPVQLFFLMDRVKSLAREHPEWEDQEPFASILRGDPKGLMAGGERGLVEAIMATHAGNTTEEFTRIVQEWIASAKHPKTGRLYTEMVYQPMLELLSYLRANGFKTYIVSGGGIEFMRPWAERVYGIPPEQVIGSSVKTKFEMRDGTPVLVRLPELNFNDDKGDRAIHRPRPPRSRRPGTRAVRLTPSDGRRRRRASARIAATPCPGTHNRCAARRAPFSASSPDPIQWSDE